MIRAASTSRKGHSLRGQHLGAGRLGSVKGSDSTFMTDNSVQLQDIRGVRCSAPRSHSDCIMDTGMRQPPEHSIMSSGMQGVY